LQLGQVLHDGITHAWFGGTGQHHFRREVRPGFDPQGIAQNRAGQSVLAAQVARVCCGDDTEDLRQHAVRELSSELE